MEHERGAFKVNHQGVGISDQIGPRIWQAGLMPEI
jgi:hypothetical protein